MRILIDTHIFLWWDNEPGQLPEQARAYCQDPANTLVLSVASVWEMQIKQQLGKLTLRLPLSQLIHEQQETNGVEVLPVTLEHALALETLPPLHKDPFDRLLIAQANSENIVLLTVDPIFKKYPVRCLL